MNFSCFVFGNFIYLPCISLAEARYGTVGGMLTYEKRLLDALS